MKGRHDRWLLPALLAVALLALSEGRAGEDFKAEAGYTSLFNGKDLTGWRASENKETFKVEGGAIVTKGPTPYDREATVKLDGDVAEELTAVRAALD